MRPNKFRKHFLAARDEPPGIPREAEEALGEMEKGGHLREGNRLPAMLQANGSKFAINTALPNWNRLRSAAGACVTEESERPVNRGLTDRRRVDTTAFLDRLDDLDLFEPKNGS